MYNKNPKIDIYYATKKGKISVRGDVIFMLGLKRWPFYDIKNSLSQINVDTKIVDKLINKIEGK